MQTGEPFSAVFCKADRARGTGGEVVTVEQAVQIGVDYKHSQRLIRLPNEQVRTMHIRLIMYFNAKKVIW